MAAVKKMLGLNSDFVHRQNGKLFTTFGYGNRVFVPDSDFVGPAGHGVWQPIGKVVATITHSSEPH